MIYINEETKEHAHVEDRDRIQATEGKTLSRQVRRDKQKRRKKEQTVRMESILNLHKKTNRQTTPLAIITTIENDVTWCKK